MRILIIGAGLSGLVAAQTLHAAGHRVTVVEKGRGVGGRLATRRLAPGSFDTGAQFFSVRDEHFAAAVALWQETGLALAWTHGFGPGRPDGHPRYRIHGGMNRLAKHLAEGLTILDQRTATRLAASADGWAVTVEPGDLAKAGSTATGPAETLHAEAVIVTAPAPQTVHLLERSGIAVDDAVRAIRYDPCLCLLLASELAPGPLLPEPGGFRIDDDPLISWVASQRAKKLCDHGDGLVVHARGDASASRYAWSDEAIIAELLPAAERVLARHGAPAASWTSVQLKKWRYSLPVATHPDACWRAPGVPPLLLAGDGFGGAPRIEGAWLSGMAAAAELR